MASFTRVQGRAMHSSIPTLPDEQARALARGYDAAVATRNRATLLTLLVAAGLVILSAFGAGVDLPKFYEGLPRFWSYFHDITPTLRWEHLSSDMSEWYWNLDTWLLLLGETILVAYVGTGLGAIGAFLLCFLASRNLKNGTVIPFIVRRFLEFCRTVPDIVFALLFVYALGLGPIPGVIAIALHTVGALGKLFSEVVENIDPGPIDGISATGANWVQVIRFAVIPQVLPNFVSYSLLRFEINVRGASVMGFVGAGGIGKELLSSIRQFYYSDVSAILLMIIVTIALIDFLTEKVRHRFISAGV